MFQKFVVFAALAIPAFPVYGQSYCYPSYGCYPVRSSCPACYPTFVRDEGAYDCNGSTAVSCGECSQCTGNYTVIRDVPQCAVKSSQQEATVAEGYQPCGKSIVNWPESKTATPKQITLSPDNPIRKNCGQSLFLPLTAAVSLANVQIERSCMEKGRPIVYASSGTDSYQIDAYLDGENIRVDLVSRILSRPVEERQTLTDQMNHKIAASLAEKISGTLIKN